MLIKGLRARPRPPVKCHGRVRSVPSKRIRAHASSKEQSSTATKFRSATEAIESADKKFADGQYAKAVKLYEKAMQLNPNDDEARAAQYNAACAHVKLEHWSDAVRCVQSAVNEHNLKVLVAYKVCTRLVGLQPTHSHKRS